MRINQYLARCGLGSRRKVEELVLKGQIFVNGKKIDTLATQVNPQIDKVAYDGKEVKLSKYFYFMLNKPAGYTVTKFDPYAKKNVFELMPKVPGLIAVGRLDRDSSGLLLLTNDGDFAQSIIHPSKKIEKEYQVSTAQKIKTDELDQLLAGVKVDGEELKAKKIFSSGGNIYRIIIMEGRNRQIRKMIESTGNQVIDLHRTRIGNLVLDTNPGEYRELTQAEIKSYVEN